MRFYKIMNNKTKESFLTTQTDETTLCGLSYNQQPLSSIEELIQLANFNSKTIDIITSDSLDSTNLKIDLDQLISSSRGKSGLFRLSLAPFSIKSLDPLSFHVMKSQFGST